MDKKQIIDYCKPYIRSELHEELETIITCAVPKDLEYILEVFERIYDGNKVGYEKRGRAICVALDFLTSRLQYFKRLPPDFKTSFGMEPELIPDTIAEWRNEKLNDLI